MKKCALCNVAAGSEQADVLYEDEAVMAVLHIAPVNKGHALVFPRDHCHSIASLSREMLTQLTDTARRAAVAVMRATDSHGFNILVANGTCAGQLSPHLYMEVIPRTVDDGVVLPARSLTYDDETEKDELVKRIRKRLTS